MGSLSAGAALFLNMGWLAVATLLTASTLSDAAAQRIEADLAAGRPVVVHLVVALCDNKNQGIAPVKAHLGNGQDPRTNLYWGALYGVKTFLTKKAGYKRVPFQDEGRDPAVLERLVLEKRVGGGTMYLVADAWDGAHIDGTTKRFLAMAAGHHAERIKIGKETIVAGGHAHITGYIGHNGLMDFAAPAAMKTASDAPARSAIVLACISRDYFRDRLAAAGAQPLLLTTNLMAPEAYTIDAALTTWVKTRSSKKVKDAAARIYTKYQKYPLRVGRRLFVAE